jgi:hypothetical protein
VSARFGLFHVPFLKLNRHIYEGNKSVQPPPIHQGRRDFHCSEDEFFKVVDRVAEIEKQLGIYDLAQFTPKP